MLTSRSSHSSVDPRLWKLLVDSLDTGVVVFDARDRVVYANSHAAHLLGYNPKDVLGLELEDFAVLCHPERREGHRFIKALQSGRILREGYEIMTADRCLHLRLSAFVLDDTPYKVLQLRDITEWQARLVAETVLGDEMLSPLVFAASYNEILDQRLQQTGNPHFDILDLVRIVRDSIRRAFTIWGRLDRFYSTAPNRVPEWQIAPVDLHATFRAAVRSTWDMAGEDNDPPVKLLIPEGLPPIRAESSYLHHGLCAMLDKARDTQGAKVVVTAKEYGSVARVTVSLAQVRLTNQDFDLLPSATAERTIALHGGRIWLERLADGSAAYCFTLPLWNDNL